MDIAIKNKQRKHITLSYVVKKSISCLKIHIKTIKLPLSFISYISRDLTKNTVCGVNRGRFRKELKRQSLKKLDDISEIRFVRLILIFKLFQII